MIRGTERNIEIGIRGNPPGITHGLTNGNQSQSYCGLISKCRLHPKRILAGGIVIDQLNAVPFHGHLRHDFVRILIIWMVIDQT